MFVVLDIGNTSVGCALFNGQKMVARWRMDSDTGRSWQAYAEALQAGLAQSDGDGVQPDGGLVSCVVQGMGDTLGNAMKAAWGIQVMMADVRVDPGISVAVPRPEGVGIDRLMAAGEAFRLANGPVVVAGVGSAITVDAVSADGQFLGGTIGPGLKMMLRALRAGTSLLPEVSLGPPGSLPGKDTRSCMLGGVVFGAAGGVDRITAELRGVVGEESCLVLTGGDAELLSDYLKTRHRVEDGLVLRGLASAYLRRIGVE